MYGGYYLQKFDGMIVENFVTLKRAGIWNLNFLFVVSRQICLGKLGNQLAAVLFNLQSCTQIFDYLCVHKCNQMILRLHSCTRIKIQKPFVYICVHECKRIVFEFSVLYANQIKNQMCNQLCTYTNTSLLISI